MTNPVGLMLDAMDEGTDSFSELLKTRVLEIITWQAARHPRNHQVQIGPSEIGSPCDRKIGYRLAQVPEINTDFDPWASTVGTAIHTWMERALLDWDLLHDGPNFATELQLELSEFITGHCDVYDRDLEAVIDWKTVGPDKLKQVEAGKIPHDNKIQAHTYGYMINKLLGLPVKKVALVFLPRASRLARTVVWSTDYEPTVAIESINRVYGIAAKLVELDILTESHGHRWEQLVAVSGDHCGLCPWYQVGRDLEIGADRTGCPGR